VDCPNRQPEALKQQPGILTKGVPGYEQPSENHHFKWICILIFGFVAVSQAQAARKGRPGSMERTEWCKSKLDSCVSDANDDCDDTYSGDTDLALCKSSEVNSCKNTYGSTSDCMSRDRVSTGSRKAEAPAGQKAITAPERKPRSPKDKLKSRAQPMSPKAAK
jgi:hypothetical protein